MSKASDNGHILDTSVGKISSEKNSSAPKSMSRRKTLTQFGVLTAASAIPILGHAQPTLPFYATQGGRTFQFTFTQLYDNILLPLMDATETNMRAVAKYLGVPNYFIFMETSGDWQHGRIRDFISRTQWAAAWNLAIKSMAGSGSTSANPGVLSAFVSFLVGAVQSYILTMIEYMTYTALRSRGMSEQPARYISSAATSWYVNTVVSFVFPPLIDSIYTQYSGSTRRLVSSSNIQGFDFIFGNASLANFATQKDSNGFTVYRTQLYRAVRKDTNLISHTASDHYMDKAQCIFDPNACNNARTQGSTYYYMNAAVTRLDQPEVSGTCTVSYSSVDCSPHANFTTNASLKTRTYLPYDNVTYSP